MLKIRLQRRGKKGQPHYRVVVTPSQKARDSKFVDDLGFYDPSATDKDKKFVVNIDQTKEWLKKGAQPSETVAQFLVKMGLVEKLHKGSILAKPKGKKKDSK
jgi:small subunit ribosomal protein S16